MFEERIAMAAAALRSGEYKQGCLVLKHGDLYCAEGVLCDVFIKDTGRAKWVPIQNQNYYICEMNDGTIAEACRAPKPVVEWYGWEGDEMFVWEKRLSVWSDNGTPFKEIADLLEDFIGRFWYIIRG